MLKQERAQGEWHMSPYERGPGGNALGGDGNLRLPNEGNTEVGQRGSGHLAVSIWQWGGRLDKTGAAPTLAWKRGWGQTREGRGVYEPAFQPLLTWEGPRKKAEVSNRTREIWPSGIIGGLRET
jgi:hypothetical protein